MLDSLNLRSRKSLSWSLCVAILVVLGGCGSEVSPTAPNFEQPGSGSGGSFGSQSTSAVSGQLVTGSGSSSSSASAATPRSAVSSGIRVSIDGTTLSTSTDGAGRFLLIGVPSGNVRMRFVGGNTNADLMVTGIGADELVQLTIQVQQASAQIVSESRDRTSEFKGILGGVDGLAGNFMLADGTTIYVDPDTWWDSGGDIRSFDDLVAAAQRGQIVELEGRYVTAPGGFFLATVVKAETDDSEHKIEGFAVAVDRAAMSLTLVDGTIVVTDLLTTEWKTDGDYLSFDALATAVEAGTFVEVEVEGSLQDDGAVFAAKIKAKDDPFTLEFKPDEWDVGWVGSGSSGNGGSAVEARVEDGPHADILASSVEMEGPSGVITPIATEPGDGHFTAKFTKASAIGIVAGVTVGSSASITVRGTLTDGTPWELVGTVEIVDEDDDEGDDGNNKLDPATAAQAIADIREVIAFIQGLVDAGDMAANNANPLINKLETAIASLEKLNGNPAVNKLEAFLNQLEAAAKTGKISSEDAEKIVEMVEDIIDLIEDD